MTEKATDYVRQNPGKSLAIAYLKPTVTPGSEVHVYLLGKPHKATVLAKPPFDPEGARLRA